MKKILLLTLAFLSFSSLRCLSRELPPVNGQSLVSIVINEETSCICNENAKMKNCKVIHASIKFNLSQYKAAGLSTGLKNILRTIVVQVCPRVLLFRPEDVIIRLPALRRASEENNFPIYLDLSVRFA